MRLFLSLGTLGLLAAVAMGLRPTAAATPFGQEPSVTLSDSFGFLWELETFDSTPDGFWLKGTVTTPFEVRGAFGLFTPKNRALTLAADEGFTGIPFTYNVTFLGLSGSGIWTNIFIDPDDPGHGTVTMTFLAGSGLLPEPGTGARPGVLPGRPASSPDPSAR